MPQQPQNSSFAKMLGGRVAAANAEHADKPVSTGNRRLPGGIRDGVARLSTMYTKQYDDDKPYKGAKGLSFFRASAIVVHPIQHNGEKIEGQVTQQIIPLCDIPGKVYDGVETKGTTFEENWYDFQNLFKLLGIMPPKGPQFDPVGDPVKDAAAGERVQAYYFAAMRALTDPERMRNNPVYISFSTRSWKPPQRKNEWDEEFKKREPMVLEDWHGIALWSGKPDPAAGVQQAPPRPATPQTPVQPAAAEPSQNGPPPQQPVQKPEDKDDLIASLVEAAEADPNGETEDGKAAGYQLCQMAWENGWTEEQTTNADWSGVGDMALNPPQNTTTASPAPSSNGAPEIGSHWLFAKRTKDGARLKNNKGEDFPPSEVEVVAVDEANKICNVKSVKDGKSIVDFRSKKPVDVKFEWLEPLQPNIAY